MNCGAIVDVDATRFSMCIALLHARTNALPLQIVGRALDCRYQSRHRLFQSSNFFLLFFQQYPLLLHVLLEHRHLRSLRPFKTIFMDTCSDLQQSDIVTVNSDAVGYQAPSLKGHQ